MTDTQEKLLADIELVKKIPIVPILLEVICQTTGMGFAAVARVTQDRWIACSVRDEIHFGLEAGGELKIETTICNKIRESRQAVIIDHVNNDDEYRQHHIPLQYGFQSYISVPIILKNGDFFGTLCAIDPKPAQLNNPKIKGMFTLFAELLAFHLQSLEMMERSEHSLKDTTHLLSQAQEENRQYEHLTYHSLREPLRKISLFSDVLVEETFNSDLEKVRKTAAEIQRFSQELARKIRQLKE